MSHAIEVEKLFVSYYGDEALQNISFSIEKGNLIGIIGPNGAGKSTLIKALLNLIPKDNGVVQFFGKPFGELRKEIAYVPQRSNLDWDFPITVLDTVLLGTYPKINLFRKPKKKHKEWAFQCLERVGMEEFYKRQIGELSGGQQQRVFIARALAQQPELFFLDEPFVGIDVSSEQTIIQLLKELRDEGKTILVVHHDLGKVNDYFDQLILLNKEMVSYGDVSQVLREESLKRAYSGQLSFLGRLGVEV